VAQGNTCEWLINLVISEQAKDADDLLIRVVVLNRQWLGPKWYVLILREEERGLA
jgi:hypothetical protein